MRKLIITIVGVLFLTGCTMARHDKGFNNYTLSEWLGLLTMMAFFAGVYMLPTIIAALSRHPATIGIGFLNLLLGWTLLGWVVCFIWALIKPRDNNITIIQQGQPSTASNRLPPPISSIPDLPKNTPEQELEALNRLRERTLITEEEYISKREKILASL